MKSLKKIFIVLAITLINVSQLSVFAGFLDVPENHKNFTAINFLQENGVINGYIDGSFRPGNLVNRAEFLKIILEGSNIALDKNELTPFADVDNLAWYAPYVKKAYQQGFINGYPDGTFKPEQTINKVEALKIIAKVQTWKIFPVKNFHPFTDTPGNAWYTPYISFAKANNYLEETGSSFFPDQKMTRAAISEIIYRTIQSPTVDPEEKILNDQNEDNQTASNDNSKIEDQKVEVNTVDSKTEDIAGQTNFTAVQSQATSGSFFTNIILDEQIPNIFYQNEVYIFSGQTKNDEKNVTLILDGITNDDYTTSTTKVTNNKFDLAFFFSKTGNYHLGMIPGETGESKAIKISVLPAIPSQSEGLPSPTITTFEIKYADDQTSVKYSGSDDSLKKLTLNQAGKTVSYFSRQNKNYIPVNYADFDGFNEANVDYFLESARIGSQIPLKISSNFTITEIKTFKARNHDFDDIFEDKISADIPDTLSTPAKITFPAKVHTDTKENALVITPAGPIEDIKLTVTTGSTIDSFSSKVIKKDSNIDFSYTPETAGTYILEINDSNGEPIVNHPIYIGPGIPLIPDYFDLNERDFFEEKDFNLTNLRTELLDLINDSRAKNGVSSITLDDELNTLAQKHADDMAKNNYFSHVNLQNQTPDDRRLALNIKTSVGENIAKDTSIKAAHFGLLRSAGHRRTMLEKSFKRIGLGITFDKGHLIIVEEFSGNLPTAQDLQNYRIELFNKINDERSEDGKVILNNRTDLDLASKYLNTKVVDEKQTLTNTVFSQALQQNNIVGNSEALGRTFNVWSEILSSLLIEDTLLNDLWRSIGIDIKLDETGNIHTIIIINDNT